MYVCSIYFICVEARSSRYIYVHAYVCMSTLRSAFLCSGPDLVIKSTTDLLPYLDKMKTQLYLLGCALGIQSETAAIEKTSEDSTTKCLRVLEHWLKVTTNPSWSLFCSKLKLNESFNSVREQIEKDHCK